MLPATGEHSRVFYEIVPEQRSTGLWDRLGSRDKHVLKETSAFSNSHDLFTGRQNAHYKLLKLTKKYINYWIKTWIYL